MLKDLKNYNADEIEQKVLKFWEENKIFEKSIEGRKKSAPFSFFDGPPFLSGTPHYGHILATAIKDAITRYKTMRGFKVERRVGWDCHGLPVEYLIEKDLGIKSKKDIEKMGIENFNNACRASGLGSLDVFEKTLKRVGRWADYSNSYFTWDNDYIESVWWVFKKLWDQNLIYKDYRVSPYCPRCETPLSNFEVNQGYKETKDNSIYVKFKKKGASDTYFLAWTTTPWTLPGNVALAVAPNVKYVLVKQGSESYILAKDLLKVLNGPYKILKEFKGKDLEGEKNEPLFDSISSQKIENIENAFKVFPADFVSTEDGTGIVHTASMYGEDDFQLGKKYKLPMFHTVDESGNFKDCVYEWKGKFVKNIEPEIIKNLESRNLIYKKEEISHTYPFCWRCDTPLLYYALDSWYAAVKKIKSQLVKNNKKINWVPAHLKEGRFGNWLKEARDWGISRNRFWGAPFPVFKCDSGHFSAFGSLKELSEAAPKSGNRYFVLRHGGASSNDLEFLASYPEKINNGLTKKGKAQVEKAAKILANEKIDLIFSSDLLRTKETAQIVSKKIGAKVNFNNRLREWNFGVLNGSPNEKLVKFYGDEINRFRKAPEKGESLTDVRSRMVDFALELEKKYKNKNILIVGHGDPLWLLESAGIGLSDQKTVLIKKKNYIENGEVREIVFLNIPRDKTGQLNMHRPYIDDLKVKCTHCGRLAKRISEVFDCWFESGAMPYGQWHYPFENKKLVENTFPADFIAEGIDQTRGWFYTLHVLASALTLKNIGLGKERPAFKNVVVNGLILAEDGQKLSKRLKNYTEPEIIFERLGADALRFFLLSSTPIGEDYRVSDRMVEETKRKIIDRFVNSYKFYELYAAKIRVNPRINPHKSASVLDKWILARLNETISKMTKELDGYDLTEAARILANFLDDLSNWYIRRSRRRLQRPENKKDFDDCSNILRHILLESSKLLAPFSPFVSEAIFKSLNPNKDTSVHLEDWPSFAKASEAKPSIKNKKLLDGMEEIRKLASLALAKRAEAGIKVRQPLAELKIKNQNAKIKISEERLKILAEEINVKQVVYDKKIKNEIELDTKITPELKEEGIIRELVRMVQDLRQEAGLKPQDKIAVFVQTEKEIKDILDKNSKLFIKEINAKKLDLKRAQKFDAESETKLENKNIWIGIKKIRKQFSI